MRKEIKQIYIIFILVILVVVVAIVLYNGFNEEIDNINVNSDLNIGTIPIVDPGPTNIACSNSSDCTGVCIEDDCLIPSCNKTANICICLGIC